MKVTLENIKNIEYFVDGNTLIEIDQNLLESLYIELKGLNNALENQGQSNKELYIDYIDKHTEYSPERTDPCPDYYGMFRLRFVWGDNDSVGVEMTLDELDSAICILSDFIEK